MALVTKDHHEIIREFVLLGTEVAARIVDRVYYPALDDKADRPAISFEVISGDPDPETPLTDFIVDFICWGSDAANNAGRGEAIELSRALRDAIRSKSMVAVTSGFVNVSIETEPANVERDKETGWWKSTSSYQITIRMSA